MGVAQNALLGAGAAVSVAASKLTTGMKELKSSQISEANDADKNEMMAQRAQMNALKMKNLQLKNKQLQLQNRKTKLEVQALKKEQEVKPNEQK